MVTGVFGYDQRMAVHFKDRNYRFQPRLLETTKPYVFIPTKTNIRLLITSNDVLHSWALPAAGIKIDACPGRLNEVFLRLNDELHLFGQCSEICGINHAFMPIHVQSISIWWFTNIMKENDFISLFDDKGQELKLFVNYWEKNINPYSNPFKAA